MDTKKLFDQLEKFHVFVKDFKASDRELSSLSIEELRPTLQLILPVLTSEYKNLLKKFLAGKAYSTLTDDELFKLEVVEEILSDEYPSCEELGAVFNKKVSNPDKRKLHNKLYDIVVEIENVIL